MANQADFRRLPHLFFGGICPKRSWGGSCENVAVTVFIGVDSEGRRETLAYADFPMRYWIRIGANSAIERLSRKIRRHTCLVGTFPDGKSALMLVTARLKLVVENEWGRRRYLDVSLLEEKENEV